MIWSSTMIVLERRAVHGWLTEVLLKVPVNVKDATPCIKDRRYDGSWNCVRNWIPIVWYLRCVKV